MMADIHSVRHRRPRQFRRIDRQETDLMRCTGAIASETDTTEIYSDVRQQIFMTSSMCRKPATIKSPGQSRFANAGREPGLFVGFVYAVTNFAVQPQLKPVNNPAESRSTAD
ncbi:hypothetical protein DPMN_049277 [Dreissena polymorpha]|uniref:Uncharacterized protein n=1 Tax=Dreissena polymorpha TaxID=45954 RepID=A0A9D4HL56_DREPO|nr:hypothetical protein DPMN_049277 [Dreissena polymorpha]